MNQIKAMSIHLEETLDVEEQIVDKSEKMAAKRKCPR